MIFYSKASKHGELSVNSRCFFVKSPVNKLLIVAWVEAINRMFGFSPPSICYLSKNLDFLYYLNKSNAYRWLSKCRSSDFLLLPIISKFSHNFHYLLIGVVVF